MLMRYLPRRPVGRPGASRWLAAAGLAGLAAGVPSVAPAAPVLPAPVGGTISTVAGKGNCVPDPLDGCDQWPAHDTTNQYDQDSATGSLLRGPASPVFDASGNLFFADRLNGWVKKVDASTGNITRVAGTWVDVDPDPTAEEWLPDIGFGGDGGQAGDAQLHTPTSLVFDGSGDLYIADQGNHRVRKVAAGLNGVIDATDTISTVAGNGACASPASGCTPAEYGSEGAIATSVHLSNPSGLAASGGDVYIADLGNRTVRKLSSGTISTVAGTKLVSGFGGDGASATSSTARLGGPIGVTHASIPATSGAGTVPALFVTDQANHNVRVVNLSASAAGKAAGVTVAAGAIETVAGCSNPPATVPNGCRTMGGFGGDEVPGGARLALLNYPFSTAYDGLHGDLYISDENNGRVRVVDAAGTIYTYAGVAPCTASAATPSPVCSPSADHGATTDGGPAASAVLTRPRGVAVHDGKLYIADFGNHRVRRVDPIRL